MDDIELFKRMCTHKKDEVLVKNVPSGDLDDRSFIEYWQNRVNYAFDIGPYLCPATGVLCKKDDLDGAHVKKVFGDDDKMYITAVNKSFNCSKSEAPFKVKREYLVEAPKQKPDEREIIKYLEGIEMNNTITEPACYKKESVDDIVEYFKNAYLNAVKLNDDPSKEQYYCGITCDVKQNLKRHKVNGYTACVECDSFETSSAVEYKLGEMGFDAGNSDNVGNGGNVNSKIVYMIKKDSEFQK